MRVAQEALNDARLRKQGQQGRFQLLGSTDGVEHPLKVVAGRLQAANKLPNDSVEPTLQINKGRKGTNTRSTGGGKETSHTQGSKSGTLPAEAAAL